MHYSLSWSSVQCHIEQRLFIRTALQLLFSKHNGFIYYYVYGDWYPPNNIVFLPVMLLLISSSITIETTCLSQMWLMTQLLFQALNKLDKGEYYCRRHNTTLPNDLRDKTHCEVKFRTLRPNESVSLVPVYIINHFFFINAPL